MCIAGYKDIDLLFPIGTLLCGYYIWYFMKFLYKRKDG